MIPVASPFSDLPADALNLLRQADAAFARGDVAAAGSFVDAALEIAPGHLGLLRRQAIVFHRQNRFEQAASALRQMLVRCPDDATVHNSLGAALGAAGDLPRALPSLQRACELDPGRADYWYNLAKGFDAVGDCESACAASTRSLELKPDDAGARLLRADALRILGRADEAATDLRHLLASEPAYVAAWTRLVGLKTVHLSSDDLHQIEQACLQPTLREDQRIPLGFAYGSALESAERYDDAYPVFAEANAAKRKRVRWDAAGNRRSVDATMAAFAQTPPPAADPTLGQQVIFIFGMPRSGSSLVEQILSAHPQVEGAGEIGDLDAVLAEESTRLGRDLSDWAPMASATDWARLGHAYLERTARWHGTKPVFTDKGLDNWRHLGAAHAMLPGARFIHCRRDPVETCWSCFKHVFKGEQLPYTYDFDELAAYWHDSERTIRFWQTRHPGLIHECIHEDLVRQPEARIADLLAYCRLPFDEACLRFHESGHKVRTSSAGQVRQPIHAGTALADRYGERLDSLRHALGLPKA